MIININEKKGNFKIVTFRDINPNWEANSVEYSFQTFILGFINKKTKEIKYYDLFQKQTFELLGEIIRSEILQKLEKRINYFRENCFDKNKLNNNFKFRLWGYALIQWKISSLAILQHSFIITFFHETTKEVKEFNIFETESFKLFNEFNGILKEEIYNVLKEEMNFFKNRSLDYR